MRQKLVTVTVGIPALNEEANIKKLLLSVLFQNQKSYRLKQIIVVSDGSTDRTVAEIKSVRNRKIQIVENKKRIGQALSQNKIIKANSSDILVLLNADVLPKGKAFIDQIIAPIINNPNVGLVGAKVEPIGSESIIGKIIDFSAEIKHGLYQSKNRGNNVYNCHGRARAFSKNLLKKFKWERTVAEDAFSYLSCLKFGFAFIYQPKAVILYKSPQTMQDHLKQSVRFIQSKNQMLQFFDRKLVEDTYYFSMYNFIRVVLLYLIKSPHLFITYSIIYIAAEITSRFSHMTNPTWDVSTSSKVVSR